MYSLALGRRKSWIVPIQATSGVALLLAANWADARLQVHMKRHHGMVDARLVHHARGLMLCTVLFSLSL